MDKMKTAFILLGSLICIYGFFISLFCSYNLFAMGYVLISLLIFCMGVCILLEIYIIYKTWRG